MALQIGYGFYAGVPNWMLPHVKDGWHVWMDPNEHNPFGHINVIGRVPPGDGDNPNGPRGDQWEHEFIRRGEQGGEAYGAYCARWWERIKLPWWLAANEPPADTLDDARQLVAYYRGLTRVAARYGVRILGGNWSRGRPDENTLAGYVEVARLCGGVAVHEYGRDRMDDPNDLTWHCFRFPRFMDALARAGVQVPVFITELGLDRGLGDGWGDGWRAFCPAPEYLRQLRWYALKCAAEHPYVQGLVLFHGSSYTFPGFAVNEEITRGCDEINRELRALPAPAVPVIAPRPAPARGPTAFSQRDPRWRDQPLGTGGGKTIGEAGCLISAVASSLVDLGCGAHTPQTLNAWLKTHGGFADGNLFIWAAVRPLGARLLKRVNCRYVPAPVEAIRQALAAGQTVIAQVDALPGGAVDQHWVRILGVDADGKDGLIMDPWQLPGQEITRLRPRYTAAGWTVARALFAVAIYGK